MRKALPFLVAPKAEIRAVGSPDIGIIHLQKKGGISPNENPIDLQETVTKQAEVQLMLQKAVARLAETESISKAEARKRLFASPVRDAETGAEAEDELPSLYDHLTIEETRELLNLQADQSKTALRAATLFIKYRVAYPVQLAAGAKVKASGLTVSPLGFAIADGQKIKFGAVTVVSDRVHAPDADAETQELSVRSTTQALPDGKIGYLCDLETGKIQIGDGEWTEEDTKEYLSQALIQAIYEFYQMEASGLRDEDLKSEGKMPTETMDSTALALNSSES